MGSRGVITTVLSTDTGSLPLEAFGNGDGGNSDPIMRAGRRGAPIYHGTGDTSLQRGVGHIYGTSLPMRSPNRSHLRLPPPHGGGRSGGASSSVWPLQPVCGWL